MRILDRERYWSFVKAYFICFVALVGLYIVIDAFSNIDEFGEVADSTGQMFRNMGRYYLVKMSLIYDQICGIIAMMAAIFTVTWMQKNNELLAMLAAGISTQRVIRPVLISALAVSLLAVVNQEMIMPQIAEELQKPPDDDGQRPILVVGRQDINDVAIDGNKADRASRSVLRFNATIPVRVAGEIIEVEAIQAHYIAETETQLPKRGGWLLRGVKFITNPTDKSIETLTQGVLSPVEDVSAYPKASDPIAARPGAPAFFLKTPLTFRSVTRSRQWYYYAPTPELLRALGDPTNASDRRTIEVFLHGRMLRPLLGFNLMLLSLPLVLGGAGRNMFVNLGMSLATSGIFYASMFFSSYLGSHEILTPEQSAWGPLIVFGTIAVARWDRIRT
ncbi:LptF/LptG family permease [Tundrisphaera sp. TA3]|uniref:LptF/LptG family permease n=1 Tax=Tundrisphaera sp. TA3 TaxID=3435775 RepID=UPI003EBA4201